MSEVAITTYEFESFMLEDESTVEITLPNGEPMLFPANASGLPVSVTIYGPSTKQYAAAKEKAEKAATARVFAAMGKPGKKQRDADTEEADTAFLVSITKRINNFPYPGGIEAVYAEKRLQYMANQVRSHQSDLGNFFKPSTTS